MDYEVTFHGAVTDIGIHPRVRLRQVEFIRNRSGIVNPYNGTTYPDIISLKIRGRLEDVPAEGRSLLEPLETALYIAEEAMTALVAKTQGMFYLRKPITCSYNGKTYSLEDSFWIEDMFNTNVSYASESFIDDADFLDEPKNFHPMYHFYRTAKDETATKDYRALNAWRFMEAFYGKKDGTLINYLVHSRNQPEDKISNFYHGVRCAVSHAVNLYDDPMTDTVIVPKSTETEFDGNMLIDLSDILRFIDGEVAKARPGLTDIPR